MSVRLGICYDTFSEFPSGAGNSHLVQSYSYKLNLLIDSIFLFGSKLPAEALEIQKCTSSIFTYQSIKDALLILLLFIMEEDTNASLRCKLRTFSPGNQNSNFFCTILCCRFTYKLNLNFFDTFCRPRWKCTSVMPLLCNL